ncbi:hypothetical protein HELRODRAFT_193797, partial [Helobdella robusta]|uniref:Protein asunder n=1 Tax=Helobdella robusta TaxID=6412 RepID=T1FVD1_HELRO
MTPHQEKIFNNYNKNTTTSTSSGSSSGGGQTKLPPDLLNSGRIVYISSFKNNDAVRQLEDSLSNAVNLHNRIMSSNSQLCLPINKVHLIFVDVCPVRVTNRCSNYYKRKVTDYLVTELHCCQSGKNVFSKMVELVMEHYSLALTTITGIPMKEEQNACSSANYDVELLHRKDTHHELFKTGCMDSLMKSKEIFGADAIPLKWCTPKSLIPDMQQCHSAYRITPVDVNSRPSLCLTNFLLGGRSVMLEHQSGKSSLKVISHMLTSHAGEIFIHSLSTFRSILEDPPSISEGVGGRLTDYRIQDFGELMKRCRFIPYSSESVTDINGGNIAASSSSSSSSSNNTSNSVSGSANCGLAGEKVPLQTTSGVSKMITPLEKSKQQLERITRYWPLTISESILTSMIGIIEPLSTLLTKEVLSEADVIECLKIIHSIGIMEAKNDPLPLANTGIKGGIKNVKREEQYKQVWIELEKLIRFHGNSSANHERVLSCLLDCKKINPRTAAAATTAAAAETSAAAVASITSTDISKKLDDVKSADGLMSDRSIEINSSSSASTTTTLTSTSNKIASNISATTTTVNKHSRKATRNEDDDGDDGDGGNGKKKYKYMIDNLVRGESLLSLWYRDLKEKSKNKPKKLPFYGELQMVDNSYELYQFMKENNNNTTATTSTAVSTVASTASSNTTSSNNNNVSTTSSSSNFNNEVSIGSSNTVKSVTFKE